MKRTGSSFRRALAGAALLAVLALALASGNSPATAVDPDERSQPSNAEVTARLDTSVAPVEAPATFSPSELKGSVEVLDADTGKSTKFASYDHLVDAYEAEGRALIAGDARLTSEGQGITPMATYVLATFYSDASYGGTTLLLTTTISTYCNSTSWADNIYGSWNNAVSSFKTFGNCRTQLWENTGQSGSSYGPAVSASSLGVMNDQASSYRIAK